MSLIRQRSVLFIRLLAAVTLAVTLLLCAGPFPVALAADTPEAEAYEPGPVRQTYNPLSKENYQGGVESPALEQREDVPQTDNSGGIVGAIKSVFTNDSSDTVEGAPVDLDTEKNPTLKRYTEEQK